MRAFHVFILATCLYASCKPLPPLESQSNESKPPPHRTGAKAETTAPGSETAQSGDELEPMLPPLTKEDLVVGEGPAVKKGDTIQVHYTGTLLDGTVFDTSLERGQPLEFTVGEGQVIPGWELGVVGMQPGGKRLLVIPPHLGYGSAGAPPKIPPNAVLKFTVELLAIRPPE